MTKIEGYKIRSFGDIPKQNNQAGQEKPGECAALDRRRSSSSCTISDQDLQQLKDDSNLPVLLRFLTSVQDPVRENKEKKNLQVEVIKDTSRTANLKKFIYCFNPLKDCFNKKPD